MAKLNVVGAKKEALVAEHNRLNETYELGAVPATDADNYGELQARVTALQELAIAKNPEEGAVTPGKSGASGSAKEAQSFIVWLKTRAYVDMKNRVDAGVYRLSAVPERLAALGTKDLEVFEGTVPPRKLIEIAKWAGIAHPEDYKTDDALLARVVSSSFTPYSAPARR